MDLLRKNKDQKCPITGARVGPCATCRGQPLTGCPHKVNETLLKPNRDLARMVEKQLKQQLKSRETQAEDIQDVA